MYSVFCLANDGTHAVRILNHLQRAGFPKNQISVLHSNADASRELGVKDSTKAPEGAAMGAGTGAILGGAVGWLAGIGTLAIPGLGPLIAAGPIMAALSGLAVGGTLGGITGGLAGMGVSEYEAQQYERRVKEGKILISVHADDSEEASTVRDIMSQEKGESISTGSEVPASA